jgi:hypothetical protein
MRSASHPRSVSMQILDKDHDKLISKIARHIYAKMVHFQTNHLVTSNKCTMIFFVF